MSCTVRGKHVRASRRLRSVKKPHPPPTTMDSPRVLSIDCPSPIPKTMIDPNHNPADCQLCLNPSPLPCANPTFNFDDASGWGYCTEEQLEDILMKNLQFLYNEALSRLVGLGYDEETALRAVLRNGHCYGANDVLTNILHNALAYLKRVSDGGGNSGDAITGENGHVFSDLRQLQEYTLAAMVCLMQQLRPHLSRGDAMWCLLMSDLHVGRASTIEIPSITPQPLSNDGSTSSSSVLEGCSSSAPAIGVSALQSCQFHSGWGFGSNGVAEFPANEPFPDIECPERFNLSPAMKSLLKRNVAAFSMGFPSNPKHLLQPQVQSGPSSLSIGEGGGILQIGHSGEPKTPRTTDSVNSILSKFQELKIDEKCAEDQKDEVILSLLRQIKDLEKQVKERKEWAHEKAMQAAKRLSSDLTELKVLRMEMEETQRLKKGKQTLEETTMKRLSEMEDALRKASGQVDRANAVIRRLETENAEIKAEMEASKLSASESVASCLVVAKREKKCLKRLLAWEKQKTKLQEEIAEEKRKFSLLQQELVQLEQDTKEAEVKWKKTAKEKELALAQVEEERRLKESTEGSSKRKLEALRLKIEIDFQRHKDDIKRLEQELSRLESSVRSTDHNNTNGSNKNLPRASQMAKSEKEKLNGETIAVLLNQLDSMEDSLEVNTDRRCLLCKKDEVSVVFLPCAHQVICSKCSENYGKKGKAACPCCRVLVEQKIRVFGASS
ncbi:hypothetical protein SAY87_030269 [Trapa incisa]|uniref:RING-type domain-containing protein n=1 Tax=Trapa incisa TaxID=236973 RepID=A0AAN7KN17_9MYRT|nr:hypothetical protein SAY87_030269 [Trapa incisa]